MCSRRAHTPIPLPSRPLSSIYLQPSYPSRAWCEITFRKVSSNMYGASHVSRAFAGGWTLLARSLCYLNSKHFKEEEERYCTLPRFNPFFPPSLVRALLPLESLLTLPSGRDGDGLPPWPSPPLRSLPSPSRRQIGFGFLH